jgi:1-acyl-sn-glycerol-3-phosphate acyltransferase
MTARVRAAARLRQPAEWNDWEEVAETPDAVTWALDLLNPSLDPSDPDNRDPEFLRAIAPFFYAIGRHYFRAEGEGLEHIPAAGPYISVGNHSGAPLLPDVWVMGAWWCIERGVERPTYIMVHDFPFRIPVIRNLLAKVGGMPACQANAEKVLGRGAGLLVYPGGDLDCLRSFRNRNRVDLQGSTGFVELAFRHGLPIVPFVCIGGQEVYFPIWSSRFLARVSGLERLTRVHTVPLILGLPWGLWLTGFVPYLPLPSKFVYRVGPPIVCPRDPDRARDRHAVRRVYDRVVDTMQGMLDDLACRRRFPVLG